jgi:NADPH:quinone reductase-like Zn-dependent oxidoreductase
MSMKAVVIRKYGKNDVVEIGEMPKPRCAAGMVLLKVHAASVNPLDWKIRSGMLRFITGSKFPKVLGSECAGEVVETSGVSKLSQGDQLIGLSSARSLGAFGEYVCLPETKTFPKPAAISFEEAACIPIAGLTALQALRDHGRIAPGKKVLINGASGGVGTFAVQISALYGAETTGVCSTANIALVKKLGADRVIDYGVVDFAKERYRYDVIFDAVAKRSFAECNKTLNPKGVYVTTVPSFSSILNQYLIGYVSSRKARSMWIKPNSSDMTWMTSHVESGRIRVVIDKVFSLDQAKEALAYSESARAKGKIVLKVI